MGIENNLKSYYDASLFVQGILNSLKENMVPKEVIVSDFNTGYKCQKRSCYVKDYQLQEVKLLNMDDQVSGLKVQGYFLLQESKEFVTELDNNLSFEMKAHGSILRNMNKVLVKKRF